MAVDCTEAHRKLGEGLSCNIGLGYQRSLMAYIFWVFSFVILSIWIQIYAYFLKPKLHPTHNVDTPFLILLEPGHSASSKSVQRGKQNWFACSRPELIREPLYVSVYISAFHETIIVADCVCLELLLLALQCFTGIGTRLVICETLNKDCLCINF